MDNLSIRESLLELEYLGFTPEQAQNVVLLKHYVLNGDFQEDMYTTEFTDQEVKRLLFLNWLVKNGKLDV